MKYLVKRRMYLGGGQYADHGAVIEIEPHEALPLLASGSIDAVAEKETTKARKPAKDSD